MSLRERKKQEKLERIEAAARTLFSERGYHETTTRAIAEQAGIGAGTLFVYFPEKRDLLVHLAEHDLRQVLDAAMETLPRDGRLVEQLLHVFGALHDHYQRNLELARVYAKELIFVSGKGADPMAALTVGFFLQLGAMVTRAQLGGEVGRHVSPATAAVQVFGVYYFTLLMWLSGSISRAHLDRELRASLELLVRGLRP